MLVRAAEASWWSGRQPWADEASRLAAEIPTGTDERQAQTVALLVGSAMVLMYQINFVDTDNPTAKVTPLDPEIRNGGGHNIFPTAAAIAATVTLVVIAALVLRRFARARKEIRP